MNTRKKSASLVSGALTLVMFAGSAVAFYDEMASLKAELKMYETAHASDFSDVIDQLGEITGSVFTDVKDGDWYQPYVTSLAEWQIVSGFRDKNGKLTGEFKPANSVTVAEALKMTMEAAKIDVQSCTQTPKHKTAVGHWASPYVTCGERMDLRILTADTIDLNRKATRAEVVGIVLDVFGDDVPALISTYRDVTRSPYESDIAYASILGIVSGDKDVSGKFTGTFRPSMPINRAEVAKVVYERLKIEARRTLAEKQSGV